jgi:hypothetical protein
LFAPAIILGTPAEAGLNQKNSTSSRLRRDSGLKQLLIFTRQRTLAGKRPTSAGVFVPKCSMALTKTFQTPVRFCKLLAQRLKWFQDVRLGSRARRKPMKKRSIHESM